MNQTYTYRGHAIDLDVQDMKNERMRWTYFIDNCYCMQGAIESQQIDAVRLSALSLAHGSIDKLDAMRSGKGSPAGAATTECRLSPRQIAHGL